MILYFCHTTKVKYGGYIHVTMVTQFKVTYGDYIHVTMVTQFKVIHFIYTWSYLYLIIQPI